jgi:prepilin-type N-terminal cleavage/methylation domain-containing protein
MTRKILSARRDTQTPLRKKGNCGSAGFTLIEVVLALTIFALLGAILYGAFSLSHSALAKSQSAAARSQTQRSTADLLGSYIRSAHPYRSSPQEQTIFFDGESESLAFISAYSHSMGGRGMAKIQITMDADDDGRGPLKLEEVTPVRVGEGEGATGESHRLVLQDRISNFRLSYLDPQAEEETWHEQWDGRERRMLPRAVRLTFFDASGREVRWIFPIMMVVLAP